MENARSRAGPGFPTVRVLSQLFDLFLEKLVAAHDPRPAVLRRRAHLTHAKPSPLPSPLRTRQWVVYANDHSAGPRKCCPISRLHPPGRHRQPPLITRDDDGVTFSWKATARRTRGTK